MYVNMKLYPHIIRLKFGHSIVMYPPQSLSKESCITAPTYVCMYISMYTVYVCMYIRMYVYKYVYVHTYIASAYT